MASTNNNTCVSTQSNITGNSKPLWYSLFYSNTNNFKDILANRLANKEVTKTKSSETISMQNMTTPDFDYTNFLMTYFKPIEDFDKFTYNYFDYPYENVANEATEDNEIEDVCWNYQVDDNYISETECNYNENNISDNNSTKESDSENEWSVV